MYSMFINFATGQSAWFGKFVNYKECLVVLAIIELLETGMYDNNQVLLG